MAPEMQRTFPGFVEGLSNAEAAELVRAIAGENGAPDLNKLYEQVTITLLTVIDNHY